MNGELFYIVCAVSSSRSCNNIDKNIIQLQPNVIRDDLKRRPFLYGCYTCNINNCGPTV